MNLLKMFNAKYYCHKLTSNQYNTLKSLVSYNKNYNKLWNNINLSILNKWKGHYYPVSFLDNYKSEEEFGMVVFETEKDLNWFLLHL